MGLIFLYRPGTPEYNGGHNIAFYVKGDGDLRVNVYSSEHGTYIYKGVTPKGYRKNILSLGDKTIGKQGTFLRVESEDWDRNVIINFNGRDQQFVKELVEASTGKAVKLYVYLSWQERLRDKSGWSIMLRRSAPKKANDA